MGHSGSTAILSELRSHPEVYVDLPEPVDHHEYVENTTLALEYTRDFFDKALKMGKTGGFKIRPMHIGKKPGEWAALVRKYNTRIVWQYRNNVLKQAVGEYSSKHLNDKASVEGLRSAEEVQNRCSTGVGCNFKIENFDVFHKILKDCVHSDKTISKAVNLITNGSSCVHALPYEDYLYEREIVMKNLQEFLGLNYAPTEPTRYKATRDNLCEVVTNWKELCDNFYGCHVWRHMFDDMRNECSCEFSSGHVQYCDTKYSG
ncbi:P-loop containing nucleoside triphosphate hydrolase [Gracilaria domingensis]|nr:P-loop containing nucleoside triphosphate hydrolase [Gracilaria domingensis]